jgi:hypothetical protein
MDYFIFISLKFYCFKILFKLVLLTWEYSKTKIGHNFLPGLARCNLNADLSLSVLTLTFWRWKKTISNLKIVNLWCFPNLLISGRCWRNDARTCPQRNDATSTTLIQCPRAWCDVTNAASWLSTTWRHGLEEIEIRLHGQPS